MIFPPCFQQGAILGIQRLRFHPGPREAHLRRGIHAGRQGAAQPHGHVDFEDLARWPGYWQWDFAGMSMGCQWDLNGIRILDEI